jgi:hypothetical protein
MKPLSRLIVLATSAYNIMKIVENIKEFWDVFLFILNNKKTEKEQHKLF